MKVIPTLEDEKELIVAPGELGFSDTFFQCSLEGERGKKFFITLGFSKNTSEKGTKWHTRLEINEKAISFSSPGKIPLFKTLNQGAVPEVDEIRQFEDQAFRIQYGKGRAKAELPGIAYEGYPDHWHFRCTREFGNELDLYFEALSRPFWFADGGAGLWTKSSNISGFEAWTRVEGTLFWGGRPVKVTGLGIVERVKLTTLLWREVTWYDWLWMISDQLHLLLFQVNNGEYLDGKIFLKDSQDYLSIRQAIIEFPEIALIPELNHYVSSKIHLKAFTDKGFLSLKGNLTRMHKRDPFQDMEFDWRGDFTYWNGGKIILSHIKGADEQGSLYKIG